MLLRRVPALSDVFCIGAEAAYGFLGPVQAQDTTCFPGSSRTSNCQPSSGLPRPETSRERTDRSWALKYMTPSLWLERGPYLLFDVAYELHRAVINVDEAEHAVEGRHRQHVADQHRRSHQRPVGLQGP